MFELARFVVALVAFPLTVVDEYLWRGRAARADAAQRQRVIDLAEGR